jgi:transcription antitermination protein NusB
MREWQITPPFIIRSSVYHYTYSKKVRVMSAPTPDTKKAPSSHPRRAARELVVQGLYQWLMTHENATTIRLYLEEIVKTHPKSPIDMLFFNALWEGVHQHRDHIQITLVQWLDRPWPDINYIERAVLLLGAYELIYCLDIPLKVVINEALETYKTFGGAEGHRYVNSILDRCGSAYRNTPNPLCSKPLDCDNTI